MTDWPCVLRVTSTGRDTARVSVRNLQFPVGRPIEFDQAAPRVAGVEYALGALGGEAVTGLRLFADRRRLPLDDVEALVTAELDNALTFLEVVGQTGEPRLRRVHLKLFVSCPDADGIRHLWEHTARSPAAAVHAPGPPCRLPSSSL